MLLISLVGCSSTSQVGASISSDMPVPSFSLSGVPRQWEPEVTEAMNDETEEVGWEDSSSEEEGTDDEEVDWASD